MCGINGITKGGAQTTVAQMNTVLRHRGPDGALVYADNDVTLGHDRLAVIDLTDSAAQPMESTDGRYVIVFNGELYNYAALRQEIGTQYTFRTRSDTEVLLAAYIVWGRRMFSKVRGIFAFAIWDTQTKQLHLAPDHMGVKPLYYSLCDGVLVFASELRGVLTTMEERTLDPIAVSSLLGMQYVPAPRSLVRGVEKLRPGHMLTWSKKGSSIERYYTPDVTKRRVSSKEIHETIGGGVKRQLVSDRPVGAFISGGIDSSIVLHHMSEHTSHVRTFSTSFEMVAGAEDEAAKFNADADLAHRTAAHYGAEHTEFRISLSDVRASLETILADVDEPVANPTIVPQYFLSRHVRDVGVVVALGGDGGDERFGGYTRHRALDAAHLFQHTPKLLQYGAVKIKPKLAKLQRELPLAFHLEFMVPEDARIVHCLRQPLSPRNTIEHMLNDRYAGMYHIDDVIDQFMCADRETWLADESLARSDRSSMAHGLELRVPLLDLDVVHIADAISWHKKTLPHDGKRALKRAYRGYIPDYLFTQPKHGWISPGAKWLRDPEIYAWSRSVLSSGYYDGLSDLFHFDALQDMLDAHVHRGEYHLYPLWNVIQLQVWARQHSIRYEH